jgi:hypothetical protein
MKCRMRKEGVLQEPKKLVTTPFRAGYCLEHWKKSLKYCGKNCVMKNVIYFTPHQMLEE